MKEIMKRFDKEFVNECGHLDFVDENGFYHLQKPTKIKRFIEEIVNEYKEALIWCSGSDDFQEGGKARVGWNKIKHLINNK